MADPFSIVSGTVSLLDVCIRTTKFIRGVYTAAKEISRELTAIVDEVEALKDVNQLIQSVWLHNSKDLEPDDPANAQLVEQWAAIRSSLSHCSSSIEVLADKVVEIVGPEEAEVKSRFDGIRKTLRKQSKEASLLKLRARVTGHRENLSLLLQVLQLAYSQNHQASIGRGLHDVSDEVRQQGFKIQQTLNVLIARTEFMDSEQFRLTVKSASKAVSSVRLNKYFDIPKAVSSLYVGRENMLEILKKALLGDQPTLQRRFVICGYGGSGKTELASKFAQDNRNRFWAIFTINGSNEETIRHGFATIAKTAGLGEESYSSGKSWLANLALPWLLIIDNADNPDLDLNKHFPAGEYGVVIITTRLAQAQILGTAEPGSFDLGQQRLSKDESNELLLRAAREVKRTETIWEAAARIAKHLGYLPLALIHAGHAILKGMGKCTLFNYVEVYNRTWNYLRKKINPDGTRGGFDGEGIINMKVFSTIEIPFRGLVHTKTLAAQDAVELLKLFSFFAGDNIRFDVLTTAVEHVQKQKKHDEQQAALTRARGEKFWNVFKRQAFLLYIRMIDKSSPALPAVLRLENFEDVRLTDALDKLVTLAFINSNENGSYSMHPLVHYWVREQPDMRTSEQALWCDVASSVLSQSILLPPLDALPTSEALKGHLLPHLNSVLDHRRTIEQRLSDNRRRRKFLWKKALEPNPTKQFAIERIKFSLIYFKNGRLQEAAQLQIQVLDYIIGRYGEDNEVAWRVKTFLSQTYNLQAEHNQAAELQLSVYQSQKRVLGAGHIDCLRSMALLGSTRSAQTRLQESKELLEQAIDGLRRLVRSSIDEAFIALVVDEIYISKLYLGGTMFQYFEPTRCHQLFREAYEGLVDSEAYGPLHTKTLEAQEEFAVSHMDVAEADLDEALRLALTAKRERKRQCGTQHPLALKSRLWLARVRSARGENEKAEAMIRKHLPVAEQNLGKCHLGTLIGHTYLALVLARQKKYQDAETEFLYVTDRKLYVSSVRADGDHADRLNALRFLLRMYMDWGKRQEALDICDQIYDSASKVGGQGLGLQHRIIPWLEETRKGLLRHQRIDSGVGMTEADSIPSMDSVLVDVED